MKKGDNKITPTRTIGNNHRLFKNVILFYAVFPLLRYAMMGMSA